MIEKRRKTKRSCFGIMLLVLLCAFVWSLAGAVRADEENGIVLQAECGYESYAKFGRNIPFRAEITSEESFQGTLRILVPANNGEENYAYEYPAAVAAGEPFVVRGEIPLVSNYTVISFDVIDEKGKVLEQEQVSLKTSGREVTELYVGVLSENKDATAAFHSVNVGEYTDSSFPYVKTRAFSLTAEDIEDIHYGMDCLDIIVLDRTMTERLSKEQREALNSWVCDGGALIAEVGSGRYIFSETDYPVTEGVEARPYLWVQTQNVKQGRVGYFTLKVADMDLMEFAVDNNAIPGSLISKVCSAEIITQIIENDHYYNGAEQYENVKELLDTAMGRKLPRISVYVVIMVLYLLLAGPGIFYVLRKKDKARLTGVSVGGAAVVFSVMIYLMGTTTRFQEPVIRYASIWTLEGKQILEEAYIDTKAPTSNSYHLQLKAEYSVQPISADSHYYYEVVDEETVLQDCKTELYHGGDATTITMRHSAPFESQYFKLERESENRDLLGLGADISYFNENVKGTVYNETQQNFENVILIIRNSIYVLGNLEPGRVVDISDVQKLYFYTDTCEEAAKEITGWSNVSYQVNSENQEYAFLSQKTKLLEYYLSNMSTSSGSSATLLAFMPVGKAGDFQTDNGYTTYGATLLNKKILLNTTSGELIYQNLSADEIINIDEDISYHENTGSTYSSSIRLQYDLGSKEGLRAVRFASAGVEEDNPDYKAFSGEAYFYNPLTLAYELVDLTDKQFWITDLEKYLTERNGTCYLIVQYSSDFIDTELYREILLPVVSVIRKK